MKKLTVGIRLVTGLLVVLLVSLLIRDQGLKSAFNEIVMGESQEIVVQKLGQPYAVVECGQFGGTPPVGCAKEFSYVSVLTFWDVWAVSFDASDRVVRKLRYRSP